MSTKRRKTLSHTPTNGDVRGNAAKESDCRRMKNFGMSESIMNKNVKTSANWAFLRVIWHVFGVFGVWKLL
jgi:hypothetical protein